MTKELLIDQDQAQRHIEALDPNFGPQTFQPFDDRKKHRVNGHRPNLQILYGTLKDHSNRFCALQRDGVAIAVTVNEMDGEGRRARNYTRSRAVWIEADNGYPKDLPVDPSLVIETSPGRFHLIFCLGNGEELTLEQHSGIMQSMIENHGSDPNAKDSSRALRLAGTWNLKNDEPFLCHIVDELSTGRRYTAQQLIDAFPRPVPQKASERAGEHRRESTDEIADIADIENALAYLSPEAREDWLQIGMSLHDHFAGGEQGYDIWSRWSQHSQKYEVKDQQRTWRGFKHQSGGVGLGTLFHNAKQAGWQRKKFEHSFSNTGPDTTAKTDKTSSGCFDSTSHGHNSEKNHFDSDEMPEPVALPESLPKVDSFDLDLLPEDLKAWVGDTSDLMQCPPEYVAVPAMVSLGAVIGRKLTVRPQEKTVWSEVPTSWGLLIGPPGVMKSPAMEEALSPIKRLTMNAVDKFQEEMAQYKISLKEAELRAKAAEKKANKELSGDLKADITKYLEMEDVPEPILHRHVVNDATPAALGHVLTQNPNGVLVYRDEAISLFQNLDREENADGRALFLTGWGGQSGYTVDRISRGMNLHIPGVCLSVLGSTQPGRIARYLQGAVSGGEMADGLIQRFGMMVFPDNGSWKDVDRLPNNKAKEAVCALFRDLDELDPENLSATQPVDEQGLPVGLPFIRFDADGLGLFKEWRQGLEYELRNGNLLPAVESHFSKYRKLVPAIALKYHLANRPEGAINRAAVEKAIEWQTYLRSHALRCYSSVTMSGIMAAHELLKRIKSGQVPPTKSKGKTEIDWFTARDIYRHGWRHLSTPDAVTEALEILVDHHYLGNRPAPKGILGGRSTVEYFINRKVTYR